MENDLLKRLSEYRDSACYPFHMPGHKRRMPEEIGALQAAAGLDITEIEGFDNLHQPEGILMEANRRAARVFGAEESCMLVNGSTAGILTAVSAAVPRGGRLIMARNCHRAVYHAVYLRELKPVYLYPALVPGYGIADCIRPEQVEEAVREYPDAAAVLITSPTYDGVVSDVEAIAGIAHAAGMALIVDAAHGAHLGFAEGWPESPVRLGADLVIQSLHKTLPALTQTAVIHMNGALIDREAVRRFEGIYQTSSPSYLLMGSIDACVRLMEERGRELMEGFGERLERFRERVRPLEALRLMNEDILDRGCMKDFDQGKLLIYTGKSKLTGNFLYKELINRYYFQMEMACDTYVTAIATPWDSKEGLEGLADALLEIDSRLETAGGMGAEDAPCYPGLRTVVPLYQAVDAPKEERELEEAAGRVSGTYVNLYPPGIPLVVPGEMIGGEVIKLIEKYMGQGLHVQGVEKAGDGSGNRFTIKLLK